MPQPLPRDLSHITTPELRRLLGEYWNDREQASRISIELEKRKTLGESGADISGAPPPPAPIVEIVPPQPVIVKDIEMPFGSMVVFMVKWSLASIPAFLILFVIGYLFWSVFLLGFRG
jgi:hypothetical protein